MRKRAYFFGIDLHKELIQVCVLDAQGQVMREQRFEGATLEHGLAVVKFLGRWKRGGRYAVEAQLDQVGERLLPQRARAERVEVGVDVRDDDRHGRAILARKA